VARQKDCSRSRRHGLEIRGPTQASAHEALELAAIYGNSEFARWLLLERGFEPGAHAREQVLMQAGTCDLFKILVIEFAFELTTASGHMALEMSARKVDIEFVRWLLLERRFVPGAGAWEQALLGSVEAEHGECFIELVRLGSLAFPFASLSLVVDLARQGPMPCVMLLLQQDFALKAPLGPCLLAGAAQGQRWDLFQDLVTCPKYQITFRSFGSLQKTETARVPTDRCYPYSPAP
jgi:hypothetical protein